MNPTDHNDISPKLERSFEVLVGEYRTMLLCYLRAIVRDGHLAEDLVQETFLTAHKSLDRFEDGGNFGAWLRGIARNKVRENQRASARRPLVIDSRIVAGMEEVYTMFDRPEALGVQWGDRLDVVRACAAKLKLKLRQAIECVYQRGRTLQEAAGDLEVSAEAIGQRLTRARRLIRECVQLNQPTNPKDGDHG